MSVLKEPSTYNFEKVRLRGRGGRLTEVTIFTPDHSKDARLNLPEGGLHAHAARLNLERPVWVPKHLRRPQRKP